ncbi:short-chain dehydrogenase [Flagellimonas aquimarina]|uniref:Short-chain dehydrogenase n=1 Tax=Flagellimonas aquimarina TaxID=2201895 RepID=A0A316LDP1_9FLAO|nr:SDR family oxidoreductase [Allomuricauda koreensis]PWL38190.1 short-chain dehydrogenase [Allomuricauda koreensis]
MRNFRQQYGPWALITGASSGIGKEFAKQLAEKGLNLILIARRQELLNALSDELEGQYSIKVKAIKADLLRPDFINQIKKETTHLDIGLLVNNAGLWKMGEYLEIPLEQELDMIDLNIKAPAILTHHFGKLLRQRGEGGIINLGSLLAYVSVPYSSVYGATKAYELSKGESLHYELSKKGVDVLTVNPGLTATEMTDSFDFSHMPSDLMQPQDVAKVALNSLGKKSHVIPGFTNKVLGFLSKRIMSRDANTKLFGKLIGKANQKKKLADSNVEETASRRLKPNVS